MKRLIPLFAVALVIAGLSIPAGAARRHKGTTTTTTAVTTTTVPGGWWHPSGLISWQWEIGHPLSLSNATDMGTNDVLPNGSLAPAPKVFDIDGIENPATTVAGLHALGDKAICYIEVGTAGNYGGAYTTYYDELKSAGDLGNKLSGYPENFININAPSAVAIVESIISQQCSAKGFDAVETDLDETFNNNEGATGFTITEANEESYMGTLANYMHSLGMTWFIKNPDDVGDSSYANAMYPLADGVVTEQCNQYSSCSFLSRYEGTKTILNAEYSGSSFCASDVTLGISGAKFPVSLTGARSPCN